MQKKKISVLVLTSSFPRHKNDWWSRFIYDLYASMPETKITVIAPHAPQATRKEMMGNMKVVRFAYFYPFKLQILTTGSGALHSGKNKFLKFIQLALYPLGQFLVMMPLLWQNHYDIIHSHWLLPQGFTGMLGKLLFKKKLIVTVHGTDIFALKSFTWLKRIILEQCDFCTVNSTETWKAVRKITPFIPIEIIPMGVNIKLFKAYKKEKIRFVKKAHYPVILSVGRLIRWKGFEYLIKAFTKINKESPKSQLIIVGIGPQESELKSLAKKNNLEIGESIIFYGPAERKTLAALYSSSDLFVCPSIYDKKTGEREAQGVVIAEALASGIPVVATNTGGIPDMIKDRVTGLLAQEKNPSDLYKKMKELLLNKRLRQACIKNGLSLVSRKYSQKIIASEFERLYLKVLSGR